MIISGDDLDGITSLKDHLAKLFEIKDFGHLSYFLGIEITLLAQGDMLSQTECSGSHVTRPNIQFVVHVSSQFCSASSCLILPRHILLCIIIPFMFIFGFRYLL